MCPNELTQSVAVLKDKTNNEDKAMGDSKHCQYFDLSSHLYDRKSRTGGLYRQRLSEK
jgi:hypothetical protein